MQQQTVYRSKQKNEITPFTKDFSPVFSIIIHVFAIPSEPSTQISIFTPVKLIHNSKKSENATQMRWTNQQKKLHTSSQTMENSISSSSYNNNKKRAKWNIIQIQRNILKLKMCKKHVRAFTVHKKTTRSNNNSKNNFCIVFCCCCVSVYGDDY